MASTQRRKKGFTLIEMAVSLGIMGSIALVSAQEGQFEAAQGNARGLGNEIFQYNSAVSRYLAAHAADPSAIGVSQVMSQTHVGASWLKDASCAGGADQAYLSCDLMVSGRTLQYQSEPTTTITQGGDGALTARTRWSPATGGNGNKDATVMGIAAMVASGNYISQNGDAAAGYQLPTVYCPDISAYSPSISSICQTERNQIISMANTNSILEPWLRTDHGNTQRHAIEFGGTRSTQAEIDAVDDGGAVGIWAGSGMRQIINVARIYNGRAGGQDSVVIGRQHGKNLFSDSFVTSNSLLDNAVVIDGDAGVMENLRVRLSAYIENHVVAGGDVLADSGQVRGAYVRSLGDVQADNDVYAQRYYDRNDTGTYMDPSARSQITDLTANGDIRAPIFYDQDNTAYYVDPASTSRMNSVDANFINSRGEVRGTLFRDGTSGYYIDPASTSRMNAIDANSVVSRGRLRTNEFLHLNRSVSVGGGCSPNGLVGRTSNGTLASCVSGRWASAGGGVKGRYRTEIRRGRTVRLKSAADWECAVGGFYNGKSSTAHYDVYISGGFWYGRATDYELRVNCWRF